MSTWEILAMAPPAGGQGGGGLEMFFPMIVIFAIFYFMLIRPQQRKEKDRRKMIENLKSGERVLFCGGILGTVTNVKDSTFVVRIADNVKIEIAKGAVGRVLANDDKIEVDGTTH